MRARYLNTEVREEIRKKDLKGYQVAAAIGIAPGTFAEWMKSELTPERKEKVLEAIRTNKEKHAACMNVEVRNAITEKNLAYYEVANALNISPTAFSHWLQRELAPGRKEKVLAAIANIKD